MHVGGEAGERANGGIQRRRIRLRELAVKVLQGRQAGDEVGVTESYTAIFLYIRYRIRRAHVMRQQV